MKKKLDNVEFFHRLNNIEYAYEYNKKVELVKGKPELVLSHMLKNTGKKTIETTVYNHNFFVMDKQPTGPGFVVKFPFNLTGTVQATGDLGKIQDNQVLYLKELTKNEYLYYESLQGFNNSPKDYDIKIENHHTGAAVRITGDQPLSKLVFWSAPKTICPEPYIQVKIKPGESYKWKIFYQFYICGIKN